MKNDTLSRTVIRYVNEYPDVPSRTLSRMIFSKHPQLFINIESVRDSVRYYRGKKGSINQKKVINKYGKLF